MGGYNRRYSHPVDSRVLQSQDRVRPQDIVGVRSFSVIAPDLVFYAFPTFRAPDD